MNINGLGDELSARSCTFVTMHKIKFICVSILFLCIRICHGQNLVLNPSFENYDSCANYSGAITVVEEWNEISYFYSPDYYNSCNSTGAGGYDLPNTLIGYQYAYDGSAMTGIGIWSTSWISERELICGKLIDSLDNNVEYCVSFYINCPNIADYSINRIGALLSDSAFDIAVGPPNWMLDFEPSIESDSNVFLNDTANWVKIEGIYNSNGGEKYIIITNFRTNTETQSQYLNYGNLLNNSAYYFIDQVSVEEIKPANAGNNQTIIAGQQIQIGQNVTEDASYQWAPAIGLSDPSLPNPIAQPFATTTYTVTKTQCSSVTTDEVTITVNTNPAIVVQGAFTLPSLCPENSTAEIIDVRGRKIAAFDTTQPELVVALAPGMYFLRFQCADGNVSVRRLVVQE
jgi:hypothetical protein